MIFLTGSHLIVRGPINELRLVCRHDAWPSEHSPFRNATDAELKKKLSLFRREGKCCLGKGLSPWYLAISFKWTTYREYLVSLLKTSYKFYCMYSLKANFKSSKAGLNSVFLDQLPKQGSSIPYNLLTAEVGWGE